MKNIVTAGLVSIVAFHSINAIAQEAENLPEDTFQENEMYLEEIRIACEAEAAGLPDAQDYFDQCVRAMKQSFSGAQD